jgi:alpha-tubulin suppressor-like RCC1 family protein
MVQPERGEFDRRIARLAVRPSLFVLVAAFSGSLSNVEAQQTCAANVISAGGFQTCAVNIASGAECWGLGTNGQVGDGTSTTRLVPVGVSGLSNGVAAVAAGGYHSCALLASGGLECWGDNTSGQLGNGCVSGSTCSTDVPTPVQVSGLSSGVTQVSAGEYHSCAVTNAGGALCWGSNNEGQLGVGETYTQLGYSSTPLAVSLGAFGAVTQISAGAGHTCAVTSSGGAICWGWNVRGQVGDGNSTTYPTAPVAVTGLTGGVTAIAAGYTHTCALTTGGGVLCWGDDTYGELGNGTASGSAVTTPVAVEGLSSAAVAIATGTFFSCALLSTGAVQCWGSNYLDSLGDSMSGGYSASPVTVSGLSNAVAITAGGEGNDGGQACAVTSGDAALCWGLNNYGQLGNDNVDGTPSPVPVFPVGLSPASCSANSSGSLSPSTDGPIPVWALALLGIALFVIAVHRLQRA